MELYPKELNKEPAELFATNEQTVNFNQFALFEKLNEEYAEHFNEEYFPPKKNRLPRKNTPQKKSKVDQVQNLKTVSKHIVNVLMTNPSIKLKNLSHIIYEIMNTTDLGEEIVEEGYPNICARIIGVLEEKYNRS